MKGLYIGSVIVMVVAGAACIQLESTGTPPRTVAITRGGDIIIIKTDGEQTPVFGRDRDIGDLAVSPAGNLFAYVRPLLQFDTASIYVANFDGSNERRVTLDQRYVGPPSFSPDGKSLAYSAKRPGTDFTYDLYIADLTTMQTGRVMNALYSDSYVDWAPDGKRLVFERRVPHPDGVTSIASDICIVNIDGTKVQCLTDTAGDRTFAVYASPAWSPTGMIAASVEPLSTWEWIAYVKVGGGEPDSGTFIATSSGEGIPKRISESTTGWLAWSPDGKYLMYGCGKGFGESTKVCVRDAGGSETVIAEGGFKYKEQVRAGGWLE